MKTMTCRQLGGACDLEFKGTSFEQIAELSKQHAAAMMEEGDTAHLEKMDEMSEMMSREGEFEEWYTAKQQEFDALLG